MTKHFDWRLCYGGGETVCIGNTPLRLLEVETPARTRGLWLKLESANPFGSIKDRTACALIQDLEHRGIITPRSILVESSSGNLGVAMAALCQLRGYRFLAVADPKTTTENLLRMRAYGAQVEVVEKPDAFGNYLSERLACIGRICARSEEFVWTRQYTNPANPRAHYESTAPEIHHQLGGEAAAVFVAVSTGGTLAGVARYFQEHCPRTRIVAVDVFGSRAFGAPSEPRLTTGIGSSQPSHFLDDIHYDGPVLVRDCESFAMCREIANETGMLAGASSGAVIVACLRYLAEHPGVEQALCLCADDGRQYRSTIYSDLWIEQNHVRLPPIASLGVNRIRGLRTAVSALDPS